ncbi:hypothetical protein PMAYCL1PPCAC_21605, partial [Pristionchus mayeri]
HQVELVIEARPGLSDRSRIGDHAHRARLLSEISSGHYGRRLVVDADFEAGRTPLDELHGPLRLHCRYGRVDVLRDDIASVEQTDGHVLAPARVALDHLMARFEARVGHVCHCVLLMVGPLCGDERCVGHQREVNARVRYQIRLELGEVDVEGAVEAKRGSDRRDDLGDQPIQIRVRRSANICLPN